MTHNISGTAKAAAQTVIATQWNAEVKSFEWWISNAVVNGSSAYARVSANQPKRTTAFEIHLSRLLTSWRSTESDTSDFNKATS